MRSSLQRNHALAAGREEPHLLNNKQPKSKSKAAKAGSKKIFEYRGSTDLQISTNQRTKLRNEDLGRLNPHLELPQGGGHLGSFGLNEIKSPSAAQLEGPKSQHSIDIMTQPSGMRPSAYQLKRQQAQYRQNGKQGGIVGRRVDAPHIIVPSQGPAGQIDFESKEQGSITQSMVVSCQPGHSTMKLMGTRGHQTASLSPRNSPWKKHMMVNHGKSTGSSNHAKGKNKNLFGQVKLCFNQGSSGAMTQNRKAAQKNFKSQPGGKHGEGTKTRTSKSLEQVRHVQRHQQQSSAPSHNTLKPVQSKNWQEQAHTKKGGQQAGGRKTVMHGSHYERPLLEQQAEVANKQRRSGATTRLQRSQLNNFLDTSVLGNQPNGADRAPNYSQIQIQNHHANASDQVQNQITLNILTATADQFINQGGRSNISAIDTGHHASGAKCKSAASRHNPSDQSRQLIQTKYLNFQRDVHHNKKRDSKSVHQAHPQQRVNHHRSSGTRAKTAMANNQQQAQTRTNSKGAIGNPFQQRQTSSQGRTSNSGGATSAGNSRAFGASKNKTIEVELKRRSKSRQGTSGILSDTPNKSHQSQKRARSGGSSNKRNNKQLLGASASFSPRSRATTQFQEARSLLFENQSSGLSVNSKKRDLNQLINMDGARQQQVLKQKPANSQGIAGSQQYFVAQTQSASILDPTYNMSAVLLQAPLDPNNSLQQYLRGVSNENLRQSSAADNTTQVGDSSQQVVTTHAPGGDSTAQQENRSAASKKYANLNVSLGRILNQSTLSHAVGPSKREGVSQSPKGSRGAQQRCSNAQIAKGQVQVSAANTSRIDKIIQENLKKQGKKTMQRMIKKYEEDQVNKKKKAELELVNERVRNNNKEKVQRRKLQQMVLMQTNNTAKAVQLSRPVGANDTIADAIRDEMTRMLDELPENAIVKSHKEKNRTTYENILHQHQPQQQSAAQSSSKFAGVRDSAGQTKQLQARTQKIDLKFSAQQRMDSLFAKVQKSNGTGKASNKTIKNRDGLPPKQLVVNRLGKSHKGETIYTDNQCIKQVKGIVNAQESVQAITHQMLYDQQQHQPGNDLYAPSDELLLPGGQSQGRMVGRFKDNRKSYGLEFIDIRKEINAEMKKVGGRKSPRGTAGNKPRKNLRGSNLRCIGGNDKMQDQCDTSVLIGDKNLRGSRSERQVFIGHQIGKSSTPALDESNANADLNVSRLVKDASLEYQQHSHVKILKPNQINMTALRIRTATAEKKGDQPDTQQSMIHGVGFVLKKEKIRKFMLRKQKQKQQQEERRQMDEIKKTLKVHQNLLNLDKYAKKKWKVVHGGGGPRTGKASQAATGGNNTLRQRANLALRKNMTLVHHNNEQPQSEHYLASGHNLTITPSKTALEVNEPCFNISAKLNQRVSSKQLKRMTKAALLRDTANGGTQNVQIDPAITTDFFHNPSTKQDAIERSTSNQNRRSAQSRGNNDISAVNKSVNQHLAPQFENSTSAKTLRALLLGSQKQNSSQSPPPHFEGSRIEQQPKNKNANRKAQINKGNRVSQQAHQQIKTTTKKNAPGAGKQQKKRGRSSNRRSTGAGCTIQLNNKQFDVRVSDVAAHTAKLKTQQSGLNSAGASQRNQQLVHVHAMHPHNLSQNRSSVHTLESDSHSRQLSSYMRRRMPSSLVSAQRPDRDLAALVIQKEVRKYLKQIGFYQARQIDSPDREPINLFIEKRSRSNSRKSGKSKSKSRSGSRGHRQQHLSPSLLHSPQRGSMQETTIIAELSGLKQSDLFMNAGDNSSDELLPVYSEARTVKQRRSSGHTRKNRQKSSSSERDTSGNKSRKQSHKKQIQKVYASSSSHPKAPPNKQLNPVVFEDFNEEIVVENVVEKLSGKGRLVIAAAHPKTASVELPEILSVQTPQSHSSKPVQLDKQQHQSEHSLSPHHMHSDSEYEYKQAHSSVESSSLEKLSMLAGQNGQLLNDGASQSSNSLFDRNAFQQYSQKKLQHIMQDSEHSKLIKFREDYLKQKERKERRHIKQMFKQNQVSPRSFQLKQKQIDRWVQVQQQEIEKTKTTFMEEWEKTIQMIEDTQKNVDQMKSKMFQGAPNGTHHSNSGTVSAQGASAAKGSASNKNLNNFNSQSCASLSSHRGYQRAHSNNTGAGNQLVLSGLGEHQRSILIEDPPKSYRSGRQEVTQIQILPIQGNNSMPTETAGEDGHGSIGLLSSRRSNGNGPNENGQASTLLQYMEQRLQSHKEQKQTSLSELKSRPRADSNHEQEDELKQAMDQIEIRVGSNINCNNLELPAKDERDNLASSQRMTDLGMLEKVHHQRQPSAGSAIESENLSHQPSAEFLERLERVNKQEAAAGSSAFSDKMLGSGEFGALDDPLQNSAPQSDKLQMGRQELKKSTDKRDDDNESPEKLDRENFKNQVMTIRDFGGIDSKRTSQQSETSNEREFMRMLANQQAKNTLTSGAASNDDEKISPTAEHLEEPSIIGKRESHQRSQDGAPETADKKPEQIAADDLQKVLQNSQGTEQSQESPSNLLQEPAIISSSHSLEVPNQSSGTENFNVFDQNNPNLVAAKVKSNSEKHIAAWPKLEEMRALFSNSGAAKDMDEKQKDRIIDSVTDEVMKSLLNDTLSVLPRGSQPKDGQQVSSVEESSSQQQNQHDVYYIDQLQSEKEERKEWIELRQRHLVDNDLIRIDQYVNEIVDALLQFDIDLSMEEDDELTESQRALHEKETKGNYHIQFLRQLTQPIQKSSGDTLQTLQTSEIGSYKHFETTQDLQKHPIIPVNLYLDIEKAREEALLARKGPSMSKQTQMVWESIHIQNKSFFDAINESLMKFRPYGLTGEPMPWSNKIRRLQTKVDIGSVDTERLFQMVKQEVFRWAQAFCGSLPSPVFCFLGQQNRDKEEFNDELFQENREKRLTQVLSAETIEQEHHWLNYEYEEAQVKIDLSDMILEHLVDEIVTFLNKQGSALSGVDDIANEESKVEIVELYDEPEFARTHELGAAEAAEVNAYLSGPMDVHGDESTSSLQRLEKGRHVEA